MINIIHELQTEAAAWLGEASMDGAFTWFRRTEMMDEWGYFRAHDDSHTEDDEVQFEQRAFFCLLIAEALKS